MNMTLIQAENPDAPLSIDANDAVRVFPLLALIPGDQTVSSLTFDTPGIIRLPRSGNYRFSGIASVDSNDPGSIRLSYQPEGPQPSRCGGTGQSSILSPVVAYHSAGDAVSFRVYNPGPNAVAIQQGSAYNYGLIEYLGE